jgi:alkyl hydroperoxide reductase subunit AhpC
MQGVAYRATAIVDDEGVIRSVALNDLDAGIPKWGALPG